VGQRLCEVEVKPSRFATHWDQIATLVRYMRPRLRLICSCLPATAMLTIQLTCLLDGHTQEYAYSVAFPIDLTIGDLLDCVENYHDWSECTCQTAPGDMAWVANLAALPEHKLDFATLALQSMKRCQRSDPIGSISEAITKSAALHLIIRNVPRTGKSTLRDTSQRLI